MNSTMLQRWATRGGKYTIEMWRHDVQVLSDAGEVITKPLFDIYEFVHASRQAASMKFVGIPALLVVTAVLLWAWRTVFGA
jgi:hypothetical protein